MAVTPQMESSFSIFNRFNTSSFYQVAIQEIVQSQHKDGNISRERDISHMASWWIPSCVPYGLLT